MDVVKERAQLYIRISDLLTKPRRDNNDEAELDRLQRALKDNLLHIGRPEENPGGDTRESVGQDMYTDSWQRERYGTATRTIPRCPIEYFSVLH